MRASSGTQILEEVGPFTALVGLPLSSLSAVATDPRDEETMAVDLEFVLPGDRVAKLFDLLAVELDQLVADFAVEMVVARVAVLVLVDAPSAEGYLADQAGFR